MKPWNSEAQLAGVDRPRTAARSWPAGALPGLALVAFGCCAVAAGAYQLIGPSDTFAEETVDLDQAVGPR